MQIKIDLKIFIFILLFYVTRQVEIYTLIMLFAMIHEVGHLLAGILLGLKPKKVSIMPLGVSITFEEYKSLKKINQKKAIIAIARTIDKYSNDRDCINGKEHNEYRSNRKYHLCQFINLYF